MKRDFFRRIRTELQTISSMERLFILFAMCCGFCITAEYAITRPTSNSLFISTYGVKLFPYAWLAALPINFLFVGLYQRFLSKWGCFPLQILLCSLTIGFNLTCAIYLKENSYLPFLLNIWKDIYVLLMFQQVWSIIHSTVGESRSKYLYGLLFGLGGIGSIVGSLVPSFFAVKVGSPKLLLMTLPIYLLLLLFYYFLLKTSEKVPGSELPTFDRVKASDGMDLILKSRFLQFILIIVVLMQVGATLIEYQFNQFLEISQPNQDLRTQYLGRLFGIVGTINLSFQFFGSFLLVYLLGLRKSHFLIPLILCGNAILYLLIPSFALITFSYGSIKSFEYSLFTILKEMLYNPLKVEEKFKAKAIIDVFAFRSSKVFASFLVLGLQLLFIDSLSMALSIMTLLIFAFWLYFVARLPDKSASTV